MDPALNLPLILGAAFVTAASPGPSTLAIAATSLSAGRFRGLSFAAGISAGSLAWSAAAAFGLAAVMFANAWIFEALRILGAGYLLYLAFRSARSAASAQPFPMKAPQAASHAAAFGRGLGMHLVNPKAILFFGALFSVGVPPGAGPEALLLVIALVGLQSTAIFLGYAIVFSDPRAVALYQRLRRWFEAVFAAAFALAGIRLLSSRLA